MEARLPNSKGSGGERPFKDSALTERKNHLALFFIPREQDDNQSYCGGFGVQWGANGGRCGICGDPWDQRPRQHEAPGGLYATGIVTKTYRQGSLIPVIIDVTANHQGHFEFKLCPNDNIFSDPGQECFDRFPLTTGVGRETK